MNFKSKLCFEKLLKFSFFSLCFGLCLYQMWRICEMYFSYKTIITIGFENQFVISLPAITLCFRKKNMIKGEYLKTFQDQLNWAENDVKLLDYLNNLTINEQIGLFYTESDVFTVCVVYNMTMNQGNYYIPCNNVSEIRKSINYYEICFTLFHQTEKEHDAQFELQPNLFNDFP